MKPFLFANKTFFKLLVFIGILLVIPVQADTLKLDKSKIELSYQGHFSEQQKQKMELWLTEMSQSVAGIYGEFPLDRARVKLVRSYSWREPVPWGEVDRWNKSQLVLHVNPDFDYQTIRDDWTAVHEMSHLLLPYAGSSGSWFSEGLASYYQNIARGNSGLLTEREAWQKLFHGFRRGERNAKRRPVALVKARKNRGDTMRIYWSGAVYFLKVDIALRENSSGRQSLASVLKAYKDCCLPNHRVVSVQETIAKLDQLAGSKIFIKHYQAIINSKNFPDYRVSFEKLGIELGWGGVRFSQDKQKEQLRRQIVKIEQP